MTTADELIMIRESVLFSLDTDWEQLSSRLHGLTDEEFLWQPHEGWSVSDGPNGTVLADLEKPDPEPPPFTSIAWRMWHLGPDCLDSYSMRAFDTNGSGIEDRTWTRSADEAIALLTRSIENFRAGIAGLTPTTMLAPLGEAFGKFGTASHVDLAFHARREIVHHGAEIGVLRDLYERRS